MLGTMPMGPEETASKAVGLKFLEALYKSEFRGLPLDLAILHRCLITVKKTIDAREDLHIRLRFNPDSGRFPFLDDIIVDAGGAIVTHWEEDREWITFSKEIGEFLSTELKQVCVMGGDECQKIEAICKQAVGLYKVHLRNFSGCDY